MPKKNKKEQKVFYYKDLLNDDFLGTNIKQKTVDQNFKFVHKNIIWRFFSWLIYYFIAVPALWIYYRIFRGIKVVGKKNIKKIKKQSYFMYGNHTGVIDAFTPSILSLPARTKIVVSADAASIKGVKNIVQMVGGLPVPTGMSGLHKFVEAINYYHKHHYNIVIYPEAHIWPTYTKIRPFKETSFGYAVSLNSPVIAFCTTYQKPTGLFKHLKHINVTIHVSEPIYPDNTLPKKQAQKKLRDDVYNFMVQTAEKYSTYEYIKYLPESEKPEQEIKSENQDNNEINNK